MKHKHFIIILLIFTIIVNASYEEKLRYLINYGKFYYKLERFDKSISYFEQVLELDDFNQIAIQYLSEISAKTDYKVPNTDITPPEPANPQGEAYQWYLNGLIQFEEDDYMNAVDAFIRAYQLEPEEEAYRIWTFKCKRLYELELYNRKHSNIPKATNNETILEKIKKSGKKSPEDSYQWFLKAKFEFNMKDYEKALDHLAISLILNEHNLQAQELLTDIKNILTPPEEKKSEDKKEIDNKKEIEKEPVQITNTIDSTTISETTEIKISEKNKTSNIQTTEPETTYEINKEKIVYKNLKVESSKDKITLRDHVNKNNKIIAGMYQLDEEGLKTKDYIKTEFSEAQKFLNDGKLSSSLEHMEKAYLKALEYNKDDLRALYYLYLISEKKENIEKMQEYFLTLIDLLQQRRFREEYYNKAKKLIDSHLYGLIIQGAYNSYKIRKPEGKFRVANLINEGYIQIKAHNTIILEFNLNGYKKIRWKFDYIDNINQYYLDNTNVVQSREYGKNPIFMSSFSIQED